MPRLPWVFRLLPVAGLLGGGAFLLALVAAAELRGSDAAALPPDAQAQPVLLAQDHPAANHPELSVRPGDARPGERDEHNRGPGAGPAANGPKANEVPKQLTAEEVEDFLAILHEQNPGLETRIRKAMAENPEKVNTEIVPHWLRVRALIELKHNNPAIFELTLQDIRLTRQLEEQTRRYRNAHDPGAADVIRAEMRLILSNRYDVRSKMIEMKTKAERLQNRDKAIDDELKQRLAQATTKPEPPRKRDGDGPHPDAGTSRK